MLHRLAASITLVCALQSSGFAAPPPPVESFLAPSEFHALKLSPDGKFLGLTGTQEFSDYFAFIDLSTMKVTPGVTFGEVELVNYWWKGSDLVLLLLENLNGERVFRTFDLKTRKVQMLRTLNRLGGAIVNPLVDDPEHALISTFTNTGTDLRKLNVRTGNTTLIEKNPGFVQKWFTNRAGQAVAGFGLLDQDWFLVTRPRPCADWERRSLGNRPWPNFTPTAVHRDQRRLLGWEQGSTDTIRVVARDLTTGDDEVLFTDPRVDPSENVIWSDDSTHVRGVMFEYDRPQFRYFDPRDEQLAAQIDAALPRTVNTVVSASADESRLIIEASSSDSPAAYYLLDRTTQRVVPLGSRRSPPQGHTFARSEFFELRARDGEKLTACIHRPPGRAGAAPLIVLVGADFTRRSVHGFHPAIQLMVSRGYAVLEVNCRGVNGFGEQFATKGNETIDTNMADDIADGALAAINRGWAERGKVAILGWGKGGILALYAMTRNPRLFSLWANYDTPMTRSAFRLHELSFGSNLVMERFRPRKDEKRLQEYRAKLDPLSEAKQITVPSFHFYRGSSLIDRDGFALKKWLSKSNIPYRFVEGLPTQQWSNDLVKHNRQSHEEQCRFYQEMLSFLAEHLPAQP